MPSDARNRRACDFPHEIAFAIAGALLLAVGAGCDGGGDDPAPASSGTFDLTEALAREDTEGFERAVEPRAFRFPGDHGPHPRFGLEWWYFTGNLATAEGRAFGFQLTLFRNALRPAPVQRESAWASEQTWLGHFAVTDARAGRLWAFERYARGALGLAGATAAPFRVWLDDWSAQSVGDDFWPLRLRAAESDFAIDLVLDSRKPLVFHGDRGLSRKSAEPGNASYYYSGTRLTARGTIDSQGALHTVSGTAWLDREWSTSALSPEQTGWDWFALQLDDGVEIMFYELRHRDGSRDPVSEGTFVERDGTTRRLRAAQVEVEVTGSWTSPRSGASYPSGWVLRVADEQLELRVVPLVEDQEMPLSFRYWEGAVRVNGTRRGAAVRGRGYVELTGY